MVLTILWQVYMFLSAYESIQACQLMEELFGRVKQGFWMITGLNFKWKHEHKQWRRGKQRTATVVFFGTFWALFEVDFLHAIYHFKAQESNASNRVRFGAETRKIWPSEENCSRLVRNSHTPSAVRMVCETRTPHAWCEFCSVFADSTLDIFFCIFWCNFLSSPCNKPITSFAFVKTI